MGRECTERVARRGRWSLHENAVSQLRTKYGPGRYGSRDEIPYRVDRGSGMTILETERLLLREHRAEDLEAYVAMEADPDVRRYVGGSPRTREEAEKRFRA